MVDVISNKVGEVAGALEDDTPFVLTFVHHLEADVWKATDVPVEIARHLHMNFPASFRIVGDVPPAPEPPPPPAPVVPGETTLGGSRVVIDAAGNITVWRADGATLTDATPPAVVTPPADQAPAQDAPPTDAPAPDAAPAATGKGKG